MQLAVIHHPWVWTLCWAVTFVCLVALGYNENARRSYPTNCITLCIFTVSCHHTRLPFSRVLPFPLPCTRAICRKPRYAHLCAYIFMNQALDHA